MVTHLNGRSLVSQRTMHPIKILCLCILTSSSLATLGPSIRPDVLHTQSICMPSQFSSTLTYPKRITRALLKAQPMHLLILLITSITKQTGDKRNAMRRMRRQITRCTWNWGPVFAMDWWTTKYKSLHWAFNQPDQCCQRFVHLCKQYSSTYKCPTAAEACIQSEELHHHSPSCVVYIRKTLCLLFVLFCAFFYFFAKKPNK